MVYYLAPYTERPGLSTSDSLIRLEVLREEGRRLLDSRMPLNGEAPYNPKDFALSKGQAGMAGHMPLLLAGQATARQVAERLEWGKWMAPERFNTLDWVFFCKEGEAEGAPLFTENWHIGSFLGGGAIGLWLKNAELASLQLVGKKGVPGRAYTVNRPPYHTAQRIQALADETENEVISFTGNVCLDFPDNMCHRRQPVQLQDRQIRYGFRISN